MKSRRNPEEQFSRKPREVSLQKFAVEISKMFLTGLLEDVLEKPMEESPEKILEKFSLKISKRILGGISDDIPWKKPYCILEVLELEFLDELVRNIREGIP